MSCGTSGYVEVNSAKLYCEIAGQGPPLILIHAGMSDSRMWDGQFSVFAKHYRTIRYDARGYGKSAMPPRVPFSMTEDLLGLLRALNLDRTSVLGLSLGGRIALDFCIEHSEAVSALVAVAPGLRGFPGSAPIKELSERIQAAVRIGDRDRILELMVQAWGDGATGRAAEHVREKITTIYRDNVSTMFQQPPQIPEWTTTSRLGEIQAPCLIVIGERDQPYMIEIADFLERGIPNARKVVIPRAAHMVNMEQPEEFNRVVLEFLAGALQ